MTTYARVLIRLWLIAMAVTIAGAIAGAPASSAQTTSSGVKQNVEFRIVGPSRVREGRPAHWTVVAVRRSVANTAEGYAPRVRAHAGGELPTKWVPPAEFSWDFGDGTGVKSTGDHPVATHVYEQDSSDAQDGVFTLIAYGRDEHGWLVEATRKIEVTNQKPRIPRIRAVEIDPTTNRFELTARAFDAEADMNELVYDWDFGDETLLDGGWKVERSFKSAGTATVKLTIRDDDGEELKAERDINVRGASAGASTAAPMPMDPDERPDAISTGLVAELFGDMGTIDLDAEILPYTGLYLVKSDACRYRFLWTAWDDDNLASLIFIADLNGLPDAKGGVYELQPNTAQLTFHAEGEDWMKSYERGRMGLGLARLGFSQPQVGEYIDEGGDDPEEIRGEVNQELDALGIGLAVGPGEQRTPPQPPSRSPLGLSEDVWFAMAGGTVRLTLVPGQYALAELDGVVLATENDEGPVQSVRFGSESTFLLDLATARQDGIVQDREVGILAQQGPANCAPPPTPLKVDSTYPNADEEYVRPITRISVDFDQPYDLSTLDDHSFQLTYPEAGSGELVVVDTKLLRDRDAADLVPLEPLWGGVTYTVRVKAGEEGVKGLGGTELEGDSGDGWYKWKFTTRVDFSATADGETGLSCHTMQSVRDVPLIWGKPAVARVYAEWKPRPEVAEAAQVKSFAAKLVMKSGTQEVGSTTANFVRQDLLEAWGVDKAEAQHTANIFWTPRESQNPVSWVQVSIPGVDDPTVYSTSCPTPMWTEAPKLVVHQYVLGLGEAEDDEGLRMEMAFQVDQMRYEIVRYAEQLLPFQEVQVAPARILALEEGEELPPCTRPRKCPAIFMSRKAGTGGHILIGWKPGAAEGGKQQKVGEIVQVDGQVLFPGAGDRGLITLDLPLAGEIPEDRLIFAAVHEIGHALHLEHLPFFHEDEERDAMIVQRDLGFENALDEPVHEHKGIEGFRIDASGTEGINKSSTEGNGESRWLVPLMFPAGMFRRDAFIAPHHYLDVQELIEESAGRFGG